jgi:hypothetical protein
MNLRGVQRFGSPRVYPYTRIFRNNITIYPLYRYSRPHRHIIASPTQIGLPAVYRVCPVSRHCIQSRYGTSNAQYLIRRRQQKPGIHDQQQPAAAHSQLQDMTTGSVPAATPTALRCHLLFPECHLRLETVCSVRSQQTPREVHGVGRTQMHRRVHLLQPGAPSTRPAALAAPAAPPAPGLNTPPPKPNKPNNSGSIPVQPALPVQSAEGCGYAPCAQEVSGPRSRRLVLEHG